MLDCAISQELRTILRGPLARGHLQNSLSEAALSLWSGKDRRLPAALPPGEGRTLLDPSHPASARSESSAGQSQETAAGRAWKCCEKPQPGDRLQLDVKFLERIAGTGKRLYQFTAIDDCTRIRVLKIYDSCNQASAIRFVNEVIKRLPFRVLVIQTDNGAEFQSRFHWHLESLDIRHVYIRPRTPHLNGKVERSHRVDEQDVAQEARCHRVGSRIGSSYSTMPTQSCSSRGQTVFEKVPLNPRMA
jgi:transposase InsO family protein